MMEGGAGLLKQGVCFLTRGGQKTMNQKQELVIRGLLWGCSFYLIRCCLGSILASLPQRCVDQPFSGWLGMYLFINST